MRASGAITSRNACLISRRRPDPARESSRHSRYHRALKPVTDFKVGQKYDGKVVYMKPFGVFLDIGCHSDAFCHISRIRDDYVESMEDAGLSVGDTVHNARVVEIDRKKKRITVSLQSEDRREDELKSINDRKLRQKKREEKSKKKKHYSTD